MNKYYTTKEVAKKLRLCVQRILAKVKQGHFPNSRACECGRSIMIPDTDVLIQPVKRNYTYDPKTTIARRKRLTECKSTSRD